jgi:hypothetical protein
VNQKAASALSVTTVWSAVERSDVTVAPPVTVTDGTITGMGNCPACEMV